MRRLIDRPPSQIERFCAAGDLGAGRGVGDELQVEVSSGLAERARHRMHVNRGQFGFDGQARDTGLLGCLAFGGGDDVGIGVLAVATEL